MNLLRTVWRRLGLKYRFDRAVRYARRFGVSGALALRRRLRGQGLIDVVIPGVAHSIVLRAGTADVRTFEKIFVWNDYDLAYPPGVRTIVDAGANIGLSAVYFANRFPDATVLALEPERENFALLTRNVAAYPRVVPLQAALWSEDTTLRLSNPDVPVDSFQFGPGAQGEAVAAFSLPSLLRRHGLERVDVMKIDIEGGETPVFDNRPDWVDGVDMFIIELHGEQARTAFHAATARIPARRYRRGEDDILVRDGAR